MSELVTVTVSRSTSWRTNSHESEAGESLDANRYSFMLERVCDTLWQCLVTDSLGAEIYRDFAHSEKRARMRAAKYFARLS